jgi:hypothetical protein
MACIHSFYRAIDKPEIYYFSIKTSKLFTDLFKIFFKPFFKTFELRPVSIETDSEEADF